MKFKYNGRKISSAFPLLTASLIGCVTASAAEATFRYYRFTPVKLRNDDASNCVQFSELVFLRGGNPVALTDVVVTNPGGNTPAAENAAKLIDGNLTTKWLDFHKAPLIFQFPAATAIDGYRFATAGDVPDRDPVRWTLEGSADGTTWKLLDNQTADYATTSDRNTMSANILLPTTPAPFSKTWTGSESNEWANYAMNWNNGTAVSWDDEDYGVANFGISTKKNVVIPDGAVVTARSLRFTEPGYTVSGSLLILNGISSIHTSAPAEISSTISTTGVFTKTGPSSLKLSGNTIISGANNVVGPLRVGEGTLDFSGTANYTGRTTVAGGTLQFSGAASKSTGGDFVIGDTPGKGVMKITDTSTVIFNGTGLIGTGVNAAGAIRQTGGTATYSQDGQYVTLGNGAGNYGSYELSGGTAKTAAYAGWRIGFPGVGIFTQSSGTLFSGRWFAVGGNGTGAIGVATFTGGTMEIQAGYRMIAGDGGTGTINVGTLAGGNAKISPLRDSTTDGAIMLAGGALAVGIVNLNSGELNLKAKIYKDSGTGTVNFNGGTLKANLANVELMNNSFTSARMFKGGLNVDTNGFAASLSTVITQAPGNGIYLPAGTLSVTDGGTGYLGAPAVSITGGSGSGASAIANVTNGVVTGVTFTCPGENYVAGDTLSFAFNLGGATTAAPSFTHVLTVADLASNSTGALVKNGAGTLTLGGASTYAGDTAVNAGTLSLAAAYLADTSKVTVATGAVLNLTSGTSDTVGSLVLGGTTVPAGTYNSTHPTYGAYFTGSGSLVVGGNGGGSTYSTWATEKGLTAANNGLSEDADNDGKTNLLEFFLDGNPLASTGASTPVLSSDETHLLLTFARRDDAEAFVTSQVAQYGSDLTGWTDIAISAANSGPDANGVTVNVAENGTVADTITVRIPKALAAQGKLFARVKVTK